MPKQGLAVEREQTEQFIDQRASSVVLSRPVRADDGAGGSTSTLTPLPAQKARFISQRSAVSVERRTVGGVTVKPDMVLMMLWDANVRRGDVFTYQNLTMEVVWVHDLDYEKLAEVVAR